MTPKPAPAQGVTSDLPTVAALDALWREISATPFYAPPNLWRYLKLRWRVRLCMVDPARIVVLAPPGKVNDCRSCTELCCVGRHGTVTLRLRDIATLLDIGRTDLITAQKPAFAKTELAGRPALRLQLASRAWTLFPVLARQGPLDACAALTPEGRCDLHPHWPLSCARFPYALHADEKEVFYSQRCDAYWIRPDAEAHVQSMVTAAVDCYNERVKDLVLLAYARERLAELELLDHLQLSR